MDFLEDEDILAKEQFMKEYNYFPDDIPFEDELPSLKHSRKRKKLQDDFFGDLDGLEDSMLEEVIENYSDAKRPKLSELKAVTICSKAYFQNAPNQGANAIYPLTPEVVPSSSTIQNPQLPQAEINNENRENELSQRQVADQIAEAPSGLQNSNVGLDAGLVGDVEIGAAEEDNNDEEAFLFIGCTFSEYYFKFQ